jgi:hypothetical protein
MRRASQRQPSRWAVIWLLGLALLAAECSAGPVVKPIIQQGPTAVERAKTAATQIGIRIGRSADDVLGSFKATVPGASDEEIALQLERAAAKTAWLDTILAKAAANRAKIAKVAHHAACDWIEVSDAFALSTPEARYEAFKDIVIERMQNEELSLNDEAELTELVQTVLGHLDPSNSGSFDPAKLSIDLMCVFVTKE